MIEKLNDKFINTWVLRHELAALAGDAAGKDDKKPRLPLPRGAPPAAAPDPKLKAFAARVYEKYEYPVDSLLFDPDGQFVEHFPASNLFTVPNADASYLQFLVKAAGK